MYMYYNQMILMKISESLNKFKISKLSFIFKGLGVRTKGYSTSSSRPNSGGIKEI